jgi:dTMP kinase
MFVTLEGPDGSGKSTASKALAGWMEAEWRCFPDRRTPIGTLIDAHLKKQWSAVHLNGGSDVLGSDSLKTDALMFQALQLANRAEVMPDILATLRSGKSVVCDRYWGSGFAYGVADGLDADYMLKIHRLLPEPSLNILLDVSSEVSMQRLKDRGGLAERYEGQLDFAATVAKNYRTLWAMKKNDPRWVIVDGSGTPEQTLHKLKALIPAARKANP